MSDGYSVYFETYGCQMNVYDTAAMDGILAGHGHHRAEAPECADVALLNTCSVREHAEHKVVSRLGELRKLRRECGRPRWIGVCGCMAERLAESLARGPNPADLVVGVDSYDRLPGMLDALGSAAGSAAFVATGHHDDVHYVAPPLERPTHNSHLVTIHKGCDYRCTYCIVPATRGPQREKPLAMILDEIRAVVAAGGREVTLLGQNVTAYAGPETDFAGLLRRIADVPGLRRIRFLTGHPRDMREPLIRTIGELSGIVAPWLHVPAQSGSDRVLRRMKRLYSRADYLTMVEQARRHIPDVTFSGDFIVGLDLVRHVRYDQTFNFKYSARPDTPAARLEDDVPVDVKKERLAELMAEQEQSWRRTAAAQTGRRWRVLVEEAARRPEGAWIARSANNRKVLLRGTSTEPGAEIDVRITGCEGTTFLAATQPDAR